MKSLLCIAVAVLIAAGCNTKMEESPNKSTTGSNGPTTGPADSPDPRVEITLTLERDWVSVREPVDLTVRVVNKSDERLQLGFGSSSCRLHCMVIVGDEELSAFIPRPCTADASPFYLRAGQSRTETLTWSGQVRDDGPRSLLPGTYQLVGAVWGQRSEVQTIDVRDD